MYYIVITKKDGGIVTIESESIAAGMATVMEMGIEFVEVNAKKKYETSSDKDS